MRAARILVAVLAALLLTSATTANSSESPTNAILTTDLSPANDVDDWFDMYTFFLTPNVRQVAVVLDFYATREVKDLALAFARLTNRTDVPVARGLLPKDAKVNCEGKDCSFCTANEGVRLILDSLKRSLGRVRIISVGGYTNEASALRCDEKLMLDKVEAIYVVASGPGGSGGTNFNHDRESAIVIVNSNIPKIWIARSKQRVSPADEEALFRMETPAARFLEQRVKAWRQHRGDEFLTRSEQLPGQGRNMWSIPAFVHLSRDPTVPHQFVRGKMFYDTSKQALGFTESADGPDMMLKDIDSVAASKWMTKIMLDAQGSRIH